jgi:hypothetical protein
MTPLAWTWNSSGCFYPTYCPLLDTAVSANAGGVRIFVPLGVVEPNQPTGTPLAGVNGQMSGQHSYDWTYPDNTVTNAISRGLQVYVQIYWTAAWANGNPYPSIRSQRRQRVSVTSAAFR